MARVLPQALFVPERVLDEADIERLVLAYLADRPNAMDTFEHIAIWWIRLQHVRFEIEALKAVLVRLTERGLLERVSFGNKDRVSYRLSTTLRRSSRKT